MPLSETDPGKIPEKEALQNLFQETFAEYSIEDLTLSSEALQKTWPVFARLLEAQFGGNSLVYITLVSKDGTIDWNWYNTYLTVHKPAVNLLLVKALLQVGIIPIGSIKKNASKLLASIPSMTRAPEGVIGGEKETAPSASAEKPTTTLYSPPITPPRSPYELPKPPNPGPTLVIVRNEKVTVGPEASTADTKVTEGNPIRIGQENVREGVGVHIGSGTGNVEVNQKEISGGVGVVLGEDWPI